MSDEQKEALVQSMLASAVLNKAGVGYAGRYVKSVAETIRKKILGNKVAKSANALRSQYVSRVSGLTGRAAEMRKAGASSESIARALHAERRALGVEFKNLTPSDMLQKNLCSEYRKVRR